MVDPADAASDQPSDRLVAVTHTTTPILATDAIEAQTQAQAEPGDRRKSAPRGVSKWEQEVRDRLASQVRRFQGPLKNLHDRQANEGDTRLLVTDFLCDVLGFDKYSHLTTEYQVRGEFADYGIRLDGDVVAFVEVKRIGTKLGLRQLRQVEMYAVNEGVEWMILTNGTQWQVYHIEGGLPVIIDLVFSFDLSGSTAPEALAELFYLSYESLKHRQIDDLWRVKRATSPQALAQAMTSEVVLAVVQRELRRITGHKTDPDNLRQLIRDTVIRPECFER